MVNRTGLMSWKQNEGIKVYEISTYWLVKTIHCKVTDNVFISHSTAIITGPESIATGCVTIGLLQCEQLLEE